MKSYIIIGAILNALAVIIGAFGAHGLKDVLAKYAMENNFETGNKYHFYHAFAILLCGIVSKQFEGVHLNWAVIFFTIGIVLFSGSLYLMGITGIRKLGAITPIGGLCFIIGWVILTFAVIRS